MQVSDKYNIRLAHTYATSNGGFQLQLVEYTNYQYIPPLKHVV